MFLNKVHNATLHIPQKASFSLIELVRILEVTEPTIRTWVKKGLLKAYGKPVRIRREDLMEFISMGSGR